MYNRYFGFRENPFSIAPDPRFLFMSEMHQDALAHLNFGVSSDGCIVLLTGEIGTGKTTICRCFLEQLDDETDVAVILNPKLSAVELLATICDEFQIPVAGSSSVKHYIDHLNRFLLQTHAQNRRSLLVIDEAQNLDKDVLEMVRLLTNLETTKRKLLKIYLLGQSELSVILAQPDMTQINQRVTGRFHLKGLQITDMEGYIRHRITIAGGGHARHLFDRKAMRKIHRLSGGIPRLINNLCDRSLLGAYAKEKDTVNEALVKKAADEIFGKNFSSRKIEISLKSLVAASVTAFLIVVIWVFTTNEFFRPEPEASPSTINNVSEKVSLDNPDQNQSEMSPEAAPDVQQEHGSSPSVKQNQSPRPEPLATSGEIEPADNEMQRSVQAAAPDSITGVEAQADEVHEPSNPASNGTTHGETRIIIKSIEVTK